MRKNRILTLFFFWLLAMIFLIILTLPDERPDKFDSISFNTTQSSKLFFRNVRSYYYQSREEAGGTMEAFRLNSRNKDTLYPSLNFTIYMVWDANLAFIRLDTHNTVYRHYSSLLLEDPNVGSVDTLALPQADNDSQYLFAKTVYKALDSEMKLFLKSPNKEKVISPHDKDGSSIKTILYDYFRLIGKL